MADKQEPHLGRRRAPCLRCWSPNEVYASLLDWQIAVGVAKGEHEDFEDFGRGLSDEAVAAEAFGHFVALLKKTGHLET